MVEVFIRYISTVGVAGMGPNLIIQYDPNMTLGDVAGTLKRYGMGENNKTIKIFKHMRGSLNYNAADPHWAPETKMVDYVNYYGGLNAYPYIEMIYVTV